MANCSGVRESAGLGSSPRWLMVLESLETAVWTAKTLALFFFLLVARSCVCSYSCTRLVALVFGLVGFCFTLPVGSLHCLCGRRDRKIRVWWGRFVPVAWYNSTALRKRSHFLDGLWISSVPWIKELCKTIHAPFLLSHLVTFYSQTQYIYRVFYVIKISE